MRRYFLAIIYDQKLSKKSAEEVQFRFSRPFFGAFMSVRKERQKFEQQFD